MSQDSWQQQSDKPLFPDLLWARPETKATAGKLLIIGGTGQSFAAVAEAYAEAVKAGVGTVRFILPDKLQRTVSKLLPEAIFTPSTPSGSFAVLALAEFLDHAKWADGVMITADTGNNSETARLFESFLTDFRHSRERGNPVETEPLNNIKGWIPSQAEDDETSNTRHQTPDISFPVTLCGDIIDTFLVNPLIILDRPNVALVLSFDQLQKLSTAAHFTEAFTSDMGLVRLVERLLKFNKLHAAHLIVSFENTTVVAAEGRVSTTTRKSGRSVTSTAATAATWWLQNPTKPYQALTTSLL